MYQCNNTSVGQVIMRGDQILMIERWNYPVSFALPAGHVDDGEEFQVAAVRETQEEVGVTVISNQLIFAGEIDNSCKGIGGTHHFWKVYGALTYFGAPVASSDAKSCFWADRSMLKAMAERTEYFSRKYSIPTYEVGRLTIAIFGVGQDPNHVTDPEWERDKGLEPVWYHMLKSARII